MVILKSIVSKECDRITGDLEVCCKISVNSIYNDIWNTHPYPLSRGELASLNRQNKPHTYDSIPQLRTTRNPKLNNPITHLFLTFTVRTIAYMKNHYQILGVASNCSQADIKKAYRQLALQHHPDKNSGNSNSEELFKEILESYIVLSDTDTRAEYDYIRGAKPGFRHKTDNGKPTPIKYLIHFKKIKDAVLNTNGHMNKRALFKVLDELLTSENINFLLYERDIAVNSLILDELITCCIFLTQDDKTAIQPKLKKLADGNNRMLSRIETLNTTENHDIPKASKTTVHDNEEMPPLTTILLFVLILMLFAIAIYSTYSK